MISAAIEAWEGERPILSARPSAWPPANNVWDPIKQVTHKHTPCLMQGWKTSQARPQPEEDYPQVMLTLAHLINRFSCES